MERKLGDIDISDDSRILKDSVAYEGASRGEEDSKFMLNIAIILQAFYLFYKEKKEGKDVSSI